MDRADACSTYTQACRPAQEDSQRTWLLLRVGRLLGSCCVARIGRCRRSSIAVPWRLTVRARHGGIPWRRSAISWWRHAIHLQHHSIYALIALESDVLPHKEKCFTDVLHNTMPHMHCMIFLALMEDLYQQVEGRSYRGREGFIDTGTENSQAAVEACGHRMEVLAQEGRHIRAGASRSWGVQQLVGDPWAGRHPFHPHPCRRCCPSPCPALLPALSALH